MEIAQLITNWFPNGGGGAIHVRELGERLAINHDHDVTVLTTQTGDSSAPDIEGVTVERLPYTGWEVRLVNELTYSSGTLRHLFRSNYDVIHVHSNTATFPLQVYRWLRDTPVVFTVHGSNLDFSVTFTGSFVDRLYSLVSRFIFRRFSYDHLVSVNEELVNRLVELGHDVTHIPNGVDPTAFPSPGNFDSERLLFVGRLRPKKNPLDIVKAMEELVDQYPSAELSLVGDGPLKDTVEDAVSSRGLDDSVTVHGYVSEDRLKQLYAESSVFVLPSEWEGHPLVLLEAWASGMPVLGTDVEGIREFVEEGETGRLVPVNEPGALSTIASELLDDPGTIERMGRNGLQLVHTKYSWNGVTARTHNLYEQLVEEPTT